jgi:hypothetical protein
LLYSLANKVLCVIMMIVFSFLLLLVFSAANVPFKTAVELYDATSDDCSNRLFIRQSMLNGIRLGGQIEGTPGLADNQKRLLQAMNENLKDNFWTKVIIQSYSSGCRHSFPTPSNIKPFVITASEKVYPMILVSFYGTNTKNAKWSDLIVTDIGKSFSDTPVLYNIVGRFGRWWSKPVLPGTHMGFADSARSCYDDDSLFLSIESICSNHLKNQFKMFKSFLLDIA